MYKTNAHNESDVKCLCPILPEGLYVRMWVARDTVVLKPHFLGVPIIKLRSKEVGKYRHYLFAIDFDALANVALQEICKIHIK